MTRWMKRRIERSRARCQRMSIKITSKQTPQRKAPTAKKELRTFVAKGSPVAVLSS